MPRLRSFLSALKPARLGVLFAVLIGLGVGFWQWNRPPRARLVLEHLGPGPCGYFSPDGRTLAIVQMEAAADCALRLWDAGSGQKKLDVFKGEWPRQVLFSPDGGKLACCFAEHIKVWDAASGKGLVTYDDRWCSIVFSSDGKLLFLHESFLHDVSGKFLKVLFEFGERVLGLGDSVLVVGGGGNLTRIWDLQTATLVAERNDIHIPPTAPGNSPRFADLSRDRRFLIYQDPWPISHCLIFDLEKGQSHKLDANLGSLEFAAMAPDGQTVALALRQWVDPAVEKSWWNWLSERLGFQNHRSNYTVMLKDFPSGEEIMTLPDSRNPVFSPDGQTLLVSTGSDGRTLQLWDLPIRKPIGKILGLAGLTAVATLLAFKGLGWLRRRRGLRPSPTPC